MEIKWLKTFIVAASYENFRKTAEELFLTSLRSQNIFKDLKKA
ncbi:hypothetical protein [uncultured Metabacillus sp.]|nr:hypothetical protein [uncultured Metabacillus sp.]